ncbi:serine hydrolase domain-containing protein [Neorhizobium sp. DT-125]|uniref:serine hydrolase domain-containing protein n=1 Tax=Neorhizobium sp. DT-125 TaxID=3396163 RepID=UPI003F1D4C2C
MTKTSFTRADINLDNWRTRPFSTWSFQNVSELVPSAVIRSACKVEEAPRNLGDFAKLSVSNLAGDSVRLPAFLIESETDALVIMRGGKLIAEWHAGHFDPEKPHIIFSISKSVTGLLAGILIEGGQLSPEALVSTYVPEAAGSAYGDLKASDLLTMTVAIDFSEVYLDRNGDYDRYRRAMLWNPGRPDEPTPTLRELLCSLPRAAHPHGTHHAYRSPNADMAALVIEAACGRRYSEFLEAAIWKPMGAHSDAFITVDRAGNPRSSGGLSMTARDLARLGELVRTGGGGILPKRLVDELWDGGNREIWAKGEQRLLYPGGSYRYFWYETGTGALAGMGIHGQQVWIDRASETVIVRLASESLPVNDRLDQKVIAMMKIIAAA